MSGAGPRNLITDVPGLLVGQVEDREAITGVTVILADAPAVASVDVRGGAPGSRETELLDPAALVERIDAIVLSGGSAFGLDAAAGVMEVLAAQGRGFAVRDVRVPIVPAAILFDLAFPGRRPWSGAPPHRGLGRAAATAAAAEFALGNAGAGLGAKAGRLKGGIGSASLRLGDGTTVGAIVAVNCWGAVTRPDCARFLAGTAGRTRPPAAAAADAARCRGFFRLRRARRRHQHDARRRRHRCAARQGRLPPARDHGPDRARAGDPSGTHAVRWRHRLRRLDRRRRPDRGGSTIADRRRRGRLPRPRRHARRAGSRIARRDAELARNNAGPQRAARLKRLRGETRAATVPR